MRRFVALSLTILLGLGINGFAQQAIAAEQIVLKFSVLEQSVSVDELSEFAETGRLSRPLRRYMRLAQQNPRNLRRFLNYEAPIDLRLLDRILNSPVGNLALEQVAQAVYTPSHSADQEALRAALTTSANDDNSISLIEVIRNYPTNEVYIDGDRLIAVYQQLSALRDRFGGVLGDLNL